MSRLKQLPLLIPLLFLTELPTASGMYDPHLGRFCSKDPIGYEDGSNMYGYVHGRSLNYFDSTGLQSDSTGGKADQRTIEKGEKECCDRAKKEGKDDGDAGGVVCCDGKQFACVWQIGLYPMKNEKAKKIVRECAWRHEDKHRQDHTRECDSCLDTERMGVRDGITTDRAECEAYLVHYRCLFNADLECEGNKECLKEIDKEKDEIRKRWLDHCAIADKEKNVGNLESEY